MKLWRPWVSADVHLRPCDVGDLTPLQLFSCLRYKDRGSLL